MISCYFLIFILYFFTQLQCSHSSDTECPQVLYHEDRRTNYNTVRIIQYNVEWLFIDYYASSDCPGNGCTWKNTSEATTHLQTVSKVIKELNPDIVNLCEVEGCDELQMLLENLNDESYQPYLKKGTDTSTGQNVGILSRIDPNIALYRTENRVSYPISGSRCGYTGSPSTTGVSKHYITEYTINDINIAVIGAHLLAIPTDPMRCAEREAQASVLQQVIYDYINQQFEVLLIGDFNDYDAENLDANNNKPISMVLDILKGNSGELAGKYQLHAVSETIEQKERYSDWWDPNGDCKSESNEFSMIDHILVSSFLQQNIYNSFIYHGYDEYCGKYDSDHYPVVIDIML